MQADNETKQADLQMPWSYFGAQLHLIEHSRNCTKLNIKQMPWSYFVFHLVSIQNVVRTEE
jgi:hypothetical protein